MPESANGPFPFRDMKISGARALEDGLSTLPDNLVPPMAIPLAYWKTPSFGAVVFLTVTTRDSNSKDSVGHYYGSYRRIDNDWIATRSFVGRDGWGGSAGPPGATDGLDGQAIDTGGWASFGDDERGQDQAAFVVWGWHTPEVAQICLVQESGRETCEANGHYGAWIIGTVRPDPWIIEARDGSGRVVGSKEGPRPPETPSEVIHVPKSDWPHFPSGQIEMLAIARYEKSVNVEWAFRFHGDSETLLTTESKARLDDEVKAKSFDSPAERTEFLEHWRRMAFLLQLTIADDLGTEYVCSGGGGSAGSPSSAVAHWRSRFRPPIPDGASRLIVYNGDIEISVPVR
jgi:hypothetical protein